MGFTILIWDHIVTFKAELEYVWGGKKGPRKYCFGPWYNCAYRYLSVVCLFFLVCTSRQRFARPDVVPGCPESIPDAIGIHSRPTLSPLFFVLLNHFFSDRSTYLVRLAPWFGL
jgi:hypothetical protein